VARCPYENVHPDRAEPGEPTPKRWRMQRLIVPVACAAMAAGLGALLVGLALTLAKPGARPECPAVAAPASDDYKDVLRQRTTWRFRVAYWGRRVGVCR
jgi:hypothetical protein